MDLERKLKGELNGYGNLLKNPISPGYIESNSAKIFLIQEKDKVFFMKIEVA